MGRGRQRHQDRGPSHRGLSRPFRRREGAALVKPAGDQTFGKASGDEEQPPLGLAGVSGGEEGATFSSVITGLDDMLRALATRFPSAEEERAEPGARCEWFDMADSDDDEQGVQRDADEQGFIGASLTCIGSGGAGVDAVEVEIGEGVGDTGDGQEPGLAHDSDKRAQGDDDEVEGFASKWLPPLLAWRPKEKLVQEELRGDLVEDVGGGFDVHDIGIDDPVVPDLVQGAEQGKAGRAVLEDALFEQVQGDKVQDDVLQGPPAVPPVPLLPPRLSEDRHAEDVPEGIGAKGLSGGNFLEQCEVLVQTMLQGELLAHFEAALVDKCEGLGRAEWYKHYGAALLDMVRLRACPREQDLDSEQVLVIVKLRAQLRQLQA